MTDLRSSRAPGAAGLDVPSGPLTALQPIVRQSVNEAVYRALRNKLMHGEYRAGQQLGIQELADALETSTMPVREALRRLVAQQGLEPMRNGCTRVPLITPARLADIRRAREMAEEVELGLTALRSAIENGDLALDGVKAE